MFKGNSNLNMNLDIYIDYLLNILVQPQKVIIKVQMPY